MKIKHLVALVFLFPALSPRAQVTAFTYQGQLVDTTGPATGLYDFTFSLFDTNVSRSAITGPVTVSDVPVTSGLFTAVVDFGSTPFQSRPTVHGAN